MKTLSVVIPAYNEESGIAEILHRVLAVDEGLREVQVELLENLVVNDLDSHTGLATFVAKFIGATTIVEVHTTLLCLATHFSIEAERLVFRWVATATMTIDQVAQQVMVISLGSLAV